MSDRKNSRGFAFILINLQYNHENSSGIALARHKTQSCLVYTGVNLGLAYFGPAAVS